MVRLVRERVVEGWERVMGLLYPNICALCGGMGDREGRHICWGCVEELPLHTLREKMCRCCGRVPEGEVSSDYICDACLERKPRFEMARTAAPFRGGVRAAMHAFKYKRATWLCDDLVDLLEGVTRTYFDVKAIDLVLPIPLHSSRERQRSYNQSALLAKGLGRRLGLMCHPSMMVRTRPTATQTRLGVSERRKNIRDAFSVAHPEWVAGRTVLVVDDVMTTGATLSEAAKVVLAAGAWRVWALAVARGH